MKKLIIAFVMAVVPALGMAAGGGVHLDHADIDLGDQASLQRGAKLFVNNCLSCHSAKYQRYNRMAKDLGLSEEEVTANLMFTTDRIGDTMQIAMSPENAGKWFGVIPPDLSVISRSRGVDWLYTYFRSFYVDESRPFGVNNIVFPDVGMPHVFWELQGMQKANFKDVDGKQVFDSFELVSKGKMSVEEFDGAMLDLTAFLSYIGEPVQMERRALGVKVIIFLLFFFVVAIMLKKEYWKDVH
ncbi:MAG: cytochrome c1 [Candidatus Polarisedimenticolaceae bacterium]|nr:cytochrome c1 [Candidatus Polarisedimenticolaceae bacterium]